MYTAQRQIYVKYASCCLSVSYFYTYLCHEEYKTHVIMYYLV